MKHIARNRANWEFNFIIFNESDSLCSQSSLSLGARSASLLFHPLDGAKAEFKLL